MLHTYLHRIYWTAGLLLLQVLIFNHLNIFGYATPFLYVYVLLKFGFDCERNERMLWGFCIGLLVDFFSDTPGMNASASVLMGFIQPVFLRLFAPRDLTDNVIPSMRTMGVAGFVKYLLVCILVHHACLLSLEFFSWTHIEAMLLHIGCSSLLTFVMVMSLEGIQRSKN